MPAGSSCLVGPFLSFCCSLGLLTVPLAKKKHPVVRLFGRSVALSFSPISSAFCFPGSLHSLKRNTRWFTLLFVHSREAVSRVDQVFACILCSACCCGVPFFGFRFGSSLSKLWLIFCSGLAPHSVFEHSSLASLLSLVFGSTSRFRIIHLRCSCASVVCLTHSPCWVNLWILSKLALL